MKIKATEIKKMVQKELGINPKDISIRWDNGNIQAYVKNPAIPLKPLDEFLSAKFEKIDYCHASGEILCGGNTFVSVNYPYDLLPERQELRKQVKQDLIEYLKSEENNYGVSCWRNGYMPEALRAKFAEKEGAKLGFCAEFVISELDGCPNMYQEDFKFVQELHV